MQEPFLVKLSPEAIESLRAGKKYYNSRSPGLGSKFYNQYKAAVKLLQRNPYYKIQYNDIRCLMIHKFEDRIHY